MSASVPFQQHSNILLDSIIFLPNAALTPSNNNNISMDSSSIVTDSILKRVPSMDKKRKLCNKACSTNSMKAMRGKREKKMKEEQKGGRGEEQAPAGYIHVRARRGQATDSHSLAERVRREKISERMKLLQALVPGCDKVSGKALMLDEIINYVKSLQHQVELLSMKLASVNPMFSDLGMDIQSFMVQHDQDFMNYSPPPLPSLQEYLLSMETETYHLPESFTLIPTILPEMYASGFQQDIMGSG